MADSDTARMRVTDLREGMLVDLLPLALKYCPDLDYGDRACMESEYAVIESVEQELHNAEPVAVIYSTQVTLAVRPDDTVEVVPPSSF